MLTAAQPFDADSIPTLYGFLEHVTVNKKPVREFVDRGMAEKGRRLYCAMHPKN